jgi:hypothetical protein
MKETCFAAIDNAQSIFFSNEQDSVQVKKQSFIWYITILRREINFLYPGSQVNTALLRYTPVYAASTSDEKKKNQANSV